jgi:hypothetical protein
MPYVPTIREATGIQYNTSFTYLKSTQPQGQGWSSDHAFEMTGSNLVWGTGYTGLFSWFSSVLPGKFRDNASITPNVLRPNIHY